MAKTPQQQYENARDTLMELQRQRQAALDRVTLDTWPAYAEANTGTDLAYFANELPALNQPEQDKINQLRHLVDATPTLKDLRDFAHVARLVFPEPFYNVGNGGSHVWICRAAEVEKIAMYTPRLAVIYTGRAGKTEYDLPPIPFN